MKRYHRIPLVFLGILLGCTQMIRVDADTYVQNQITNSCRVKGLK
jgi:hypothetical protein